MQIIDMERQIQNDSKEVPPMLINGKGIPTTGRIPTTMPKFTKIVVTKIKLNPPIVNLQNLSRALNDK